jgi:geranylgeranyl diphosphate synthase, type II
MAAEKTTYPALFGLDQSLKKADNLVNAACSMLDRFGKRADTLKALAHFLVERKR